MRMRYILKMRTVIYRELIVETDVGHCGIVDWDSYRG